MNLKMPTWTKLVLSFAVVAAAAYWGYSCRNPDAVETFGEKHEWSILQTMQIPQMLLKPGGSMFFKVDGYEVMGIPSLKGGTILIMLKPQSPPYYKQMPPNGDYVIKQELIDKLVLENRVGYTTSAVLDSHALPREHQH